MGKPDIFIVANPDKPLAHQAYERFLQEIESKANIVGKSLDIKPQNLQSVKADFIVSLGGDGTILAVARATGHQPIPIIGVNLGKLGFLAEYSIDELLSQFEKVTSSPDLICERMVLKVQVDKPDGSTSFSSLAINDVCIIAGSPFRMIEMKVSINSMKFTQFLGDGLIFSTPTGSTAYNMSVGGPILLPKVRGIVVSPIAPHSLAFRPVVVDYDRLIKTTMTRVNEGTTLMVDGQIPITLESEDVVHLSRHEKDFKLVSNARNAPWDTLIAKLGWGQSPFYNSNT